MELVKINEAYNLIDNTADNWSVTGLVTKELSGILHINFSASVSEKYIGSYNYNTSDNNTVSINVNCDKNIEDEFYKYSNSLVDQILEHLSKE